MTPRTPQGRSLSAPHRLTAALVPGAVLLAVLAGAGSAPPRAGGPPSGPAPSSAVASSAAASRVVVQAGDEAVAAAAVRRLGGRVGRSLPIVGGVAAELPAAALGALRASPGVRAVTPDVAMAPKTYQAPLGYDPDTTYGSLYKVAAVTGAHAAFKAGFSGKGVDVALIDSGVAPVQGLTSGNVLNGPDLSFDSQEPNLVHNDSFGHGTHMASIINGRDVTRSRAAGYVDQTGFYGIAPDARLVNVKVAASDGGTDVSQVIAAINWVVENRARDGLNVRVLSLSYGTDSTQDPQLDPLSHAVEQAWKAGIVVVAAGGNDGTDKRYLGMPARNKYVLAVGAQDTLGTHTTNDDVVPSWASRGTNDRHVDLVAPAVSIHGLRSPNSAIDAANPQARTGTRFLRGNGTSQATAVVAGAAALFLQKYPLARPDEVKRALTQSAAPFPNSPQIYRGAGALQIGNAIKGAVPNNLQGFSTSTGTGSLEASRGSTHVVDMGPDDTQTVELRGEVDIFGRPFDAAAWASRTTGRTTWSGGSWMGSPWAGDGWAASGSWTGRTWTGRTWTAGNWAGRTWTGRTWTGRTWTGSSWDSGSWDGRTWTGRTWTGRTWTGDDWSMVEWQ